MRRGMRILTIDRMLTVSLGPVPLHVQGVRSSIRFVFPRGYDVE